jgi:hypothetical protein
MQLLGKLCIWTALVMLLLLGQSFSANVMACNYYASPSGGSNGLSPSSPFTIANFWGVAGAGKTLCLLDGVYTGANSIIKPPSGLNGTASNKITIKALNDGKVRINGEGVRRPIELLNNDHFVIDGINAHNSSADVIHIGKGADNNIIRRVVAWDANVNLNVHVWQVNGNSGNLLEDVAGFGTGRKIFSNSQGGNNLTIRRAWGMWEKTFDGAPKITYTYMYNSTGATYENIIGTWNQSPGSNTSQTQAIIGTDTQPSSLYCTGSKVLGSMAYLPGSYTQNGWIGGVMASRAADCIEFKDIVSYVGRTDRRPIFAYKFDGGSTSNAVDCPVCDRRLTNVTEVGGSASSIYTSAPNRWTVTNRVDVDTISAMNAAGANPFQAKAGNGARMCFRYINGTLTSTPLWPWPMNQRIIDATSAAGKTPVDVTKTIEDIFGTIPNECRSGSVASTAPAPTTTTSLPTSPTSLRAQ